MEVPKNEQENSPNAARARHVKCLIIGSGPAGYTAAIYAARANLKPVIIQGLQPGGQLTTTTEIDNFPGYPNGVTGPEMMEDLRKQAERFGTEILWGIVTEVDFSVSPKKVFLDDGTSFLSDTVIISTGATAKYLGLESEKRLMGNGVSGCATCDGFFYKGKTVAVVGGGDTACEEATYLAGLCKQVYLIVRKDFLRASKAMQERVFNTANITVLFEHETEEVIGQQFVTGVKLIKRRGKPDQVIYDIAVDGFFLAIGHSPNSDLFKAFLNTDTTGYIITTPGSTHTNIEGVFACGDVQDPRYRQAITAAGTGCMAAMDAERFLVEKGL